jgi:hypothetical protein
MLENQILFIFFIPLLSGYIVSRKSEFYPVMQWLIGLLMVSVLLMTMHGYGFLKDTTFNSIYLMSVFGFLLYVRDVFNIGVKNYIYKIKKITLNLSLADVIFIFVVLVFLIEAISSIERYPLSAGDALAYWYQKAKFLYSWEALKEFPTTSYPNLGSSIWMLGMNFYNGIESMGRTLFPIMVSVIFLSKWQLLRATYVINNKELLFLSLFFSYSYLSLMTSTFGGSFTYVYSGYVDWMIGIIPAAAYIFLILDAVESSKRVRKNKPYEFNFKRVSVLFFLISCASIIKMEGYVITIIYIFSYLMTLFFLNNKNLFNDNKGKIFIVLGLTVFVSSLYIQVLFYNNIDFVAAQSFMFTDLYSLVERFLPILKYFASNIKNEIDVIIPFFVIAFLTYKSKKHYVLLSIISPIVLYYGFMIVVYLLTSVSLEWHLATSFERLFHQISYMYIFGGIFLLFENMAIANGVKNSSVQS